MCVAVGHIICCHEAAELAPAVFCTPESLQAAARSVTKVQHAVRHLQTLQIEPLPDKRMAQQLLTSPDCCCGSRGHGWSICRRLISQWLISKQLPACEARSCILNAATKVGHAHNAFHDICY